MLVLLCEALCAERLTCSTAGTYRLMPEIFALKNILHPSFLKYSEAYVTVILNCMLKCVCKSHSFILLVLVIGEFMNALSADLLADFCRF